MSLEFSPAALDRWITGDYGQDQYCDQDERTIREECEWCHGLGHAIDVSDEHQPDPRHDVVCLAIRGSHFTKFGSLVMYCIMAGRILDALDRASKAGLLWEVGCGTDDFIPCPRDTEFHGVHSVPCDECDGKGFKEFLC